MDIQYVIGPLASVLGVIVSVLAIVGSNRSLKIDLKREIKADIKAELDTRFGAVDARFDAVDARFNAMDARFAAMDKKIDTVKADLSAQIVGNTRRIEALDDRVYQLTLTMAGFRQDLNDIQKQHQIPVAA